jgi:uncharacterized repeat protein (TIGR02543 family)
MPDEALTLTGYADINSYTIEASGTNVLGATPATANHGATPVITINVTTGYHITSVTSVTMGETELTLGDDYTVSGDTVTLIKDVDGDIVIVANAALIEWTVTFDPNNGDSMWDVTVGSGNAVSKPTPDPVKDGYWFLGWFEEDATDAWDFGTLIYGDLTLTAEWVDAPWSVTITTERNDSFTYTVTYGGSTISGSFTLTSDPGDEKVLSDIPTGATITVTAAAQSGYNIEWDDTEDRFPGPTYTNTMTGNVTLTAIFVPTGHGGGMSLWFILALLLLAFAVALYIMGWRRTHIMGTAYCGNETLQGVKIGYKTKGGNGEVRYVVTDSNGNYTITVLKNSDIIVSASKEGYELVSATVDGKEISLSSLLNLRIEEHSTIMDLWYKKK